MALNPVLFNRLETYGLTNAHLEQLLGLCEQGRGRATWHITPECGIDKIELTFFGSTKDTRSMRNLSQLLQKDHR